MTYFLTFWAGGVAGYGLCLFIWRRVRASAAPTGVAELIEIASRCTSISETIEREDRGDGEERYIVRGVPCGLPVAKFGDFNDAHLFVAATKLRAPPHRKGVEPK